MSGSAKSYLFDLWTFAKLRFIWLFALTLLVGLTESIGLLLLVPLLVVVGAADSAGSPIAESISQVMAHLGIPFTLVWILAIYVSLVCLRAALSYARAVLAARLRLEFVDHLRMRLFNAVAKANWLFHLERRASDISHTVMADINRVGVGTTLVFDSAMRILLTAAYVAVAFKLSAPITMVAVALAVVLGAVLWPQVRRSRRIGAIQTSRGKRSFASQAEFLAGMKLAKSHGNEGQHVDAYESEVRRVREAVLGFQKVSARTSTAFQIGTVASIAGIVYLAVEVVKVPAAELLALVAVVSRIAPAASTILGKAQGAANMLPAYGSAQKLLSEAVAASEPAVGFGTARPLEQAIGLSNVSFIYPSGVPAIDSVSLSIPARKTTAMVGPSGAGKTTLADILLGLINPSSGEMTVDGVPLSEFGLDRWRQQLAYVPQDPFLFHDTLQANIEWAANAPLSQAEVIDLVHSAALGPLVAKLPDGLDTIVGDRGFRLSGGERQRVALARALARRPTLLVLDEATSSLDGENESAVQDAIDALHGELTVVVIAHRMSTIRHADQIVVVDNGRVAESGSWDELIGNDGRLAYLAGFSAASESSQ